MENKLVIKRGVTMEFQEDKEIQKAGTEIYAWLRHEKYTIQQSIQILQYVTQNLKIAVTIREHQRQQKQRDEKNDE